jgi:hypothetical protein
MFSFWSQTGFSFAKYPFVGYTAGNYTNVALDESKKQIANDAPIIHEMMESMIRNQVEHVLLKRKK